MIPSRAPNLNDLIRAKGSGYKGKYNLIKRRWHELVRDAAIASRVAPCQGPQCFTYLCLEPTRQRDPSNFLAGAIKMIEDGLQGAGVIAGDGWPHVAGIVGYWDVDRSSPSVHVWLGDRILTRGEALDWASQS